MDQVFCFVYCLLTRTREADLHSDDNRQRSDLPSARKARLCVIGEGDLRPVSWLPTASLTVNPDTARSVFLPLDMYAINSTKDILCSLS